jgi:GDP/UDP-N,N'-diacetylbacillosamine 2-epimerase (hydrolysing)
MTQRKIVYVTGTRADYGLMKAVLQRLNDADGFDLSICVTGMHLSSLYGNTINEIEADSFKICGVIPVDVDRTTHVSMSKSTGYQIISMTEVFDKEQPDLILLLGDRGEMLAAAIAAVHLNIPIVHLHGGERSGTIDEMFRHAISKCSHYHFVTTEASKDRLIKMGEKEEAIFVVGAPGLDEIALYVPCDREVFYSSYLLDSQKKTALMLYHPVVQEFHNIEEQVQNLFNATLSIGLQIICLEPNSDAGGQKIRSVLQEYDNYPDVRIVKHLPRREFINCMAHVDVMIGNSSSGIIEAASFNLPVVNVGSRQNLREHGCNVINANTSIESITNSLKRALEQDKKSYTNIYGDGKTSERCYQLLKNINLDSSILNKTNTY